ncbi:hypothetical protein CEUSTIGMA_g1958.t1 [Chlamydomonas eustigma]|uniref:PDZ domain-containing protein n=1 Tax=Chlamydomonas eustigma TaxID=1157962 RepID=A0A250WUX8_9CHLO|nr:hypothetical protein CEUSTIGMA_g1958.t1 [Chlamydomonas eustigma]|eukprot:GAX74509.1 hypothetical protein CEUSTIGMA_g1958.t1 [Chlamydomonas eustigma]
MVVIATQHASFSERKQAPVKFYSKKGKPHSSGPTCARGVCICRVNTEEKKSILKYTNELTFNLNEYMVVLDKPLGLTLAPDPVEGHIVVQSIKDGSPASSCQLIQVGDVVRKCSAVFGEDMWQATDIRRMRWAINNRTSKVKLVLERPKRPLLSVPVWYSKGQSGAASFDREVMMQLPISFQSSASTSDDWNQDTVALGKPLYVSFHRSGLPPGQLAQRNSSRAARHARLQQLRDELDQVGHAAVIDLTLNPLRSATDHQKASISKKQPDPSQSIKGTAKGKQILTLLPWLLVAPSRLDTRGLASLATTRGINAILELSLVINQEGHLAVRGSEREIQLQQVHVGSLIPSTSEPHGSAPGDASSTSSSNSSDQALSTVLSTVGSPRGPPDGAQAPASRRVVTSSTLGRKEAQLHNLIHAAASLQRLAFRRRGSSFHHSAPERCAVLLHCHEEGVRAQVGDLLAAWLYWYKGMPLQEAILSTQMGTGCAVQQSLIEVATESLVYAGDERLSREVLTWKYGAMSVAVAGDIVGGWQNRVPLLRCVNPTGCKGSTERGHFFLPLIGLKPGVYFYKFIVNGTWTVDPTAPKVIDTEGNYNNVLEVHARPPSVTSKEKLQLARWQAANVALETKLMSGFRLN